MNFENQGEPFAIVKLDEKSSKSKNTPILSISDENLAQTCFKEFTLKGNDHFQLIPNPKKERQILYISGASGSGKSYFAKEYCNEFKKVFPKRDIYLISSLNEDLGSIDKIKDLKKIKLSDSFLEDELTAKDFQNSLVIFDDTDCLTNKPMKLKVQALLNSILETGRHFNVYCIYTSHLPCAGNDTRRILNEAHSITFFPKSLNGVTLKNLLQNYLGLDKNQIRKLKNLKSRAITVVKSFPQVVLGEKDAYILQVDI